MLPSRVQIADSVIFQRLNDEAVLLDMSTQQYFGLDPVGTKMWELLVETGDPQIVASRMTDLYDVPLATLQQDLGTLIENLVGAGLLTSRNS